MPVASSRMVMPWKGPAKSLPRYAPLSIAAPVRLAKAVYSFSTLVTLGRVRKGELLQELLRCSVAQGLMGPDGVIDPLPDESVLVEFGHGPGEVSHLVELLGVGSVGPFYVAVEFGGAGRQHKEADPPLLASLLEDSLELGAAVYLDGPHREGGPLLEAVQEAAGSRGGGSTGHHQDVPAGHHVAGGELLQHYPRQGAQVQSIHLYQVSRKGHAIVLGFPHCIGAEPGTLAGGDGPSGRGYQYTLLPKPPQKASYHGGRDRPAFPPGQHPQV